LAVACAQVGSPLCQALDEDLFLGGAEVVREVLVKAVGRAGLAVRVCGRLAACVGAGAGLASTGVVGGVGSRESPGCGLSEESTVGVGSAALDVRVAPDCPPGLAFMSAHICR
jgi:hypothetical protein